MNWRRTILGARDHPRPDKIGLNLAAAETRSFGASAARSCVAESRYSCTGGDAHNGPPATSLTASFLLTLLAINVGLSLSRKSASELK